MLVIPRRLVVLFVGVVCIGAAAAVTQRTAETLPPAHFTQQLQSCPGVSSDEALNDAATADCLRDVLVRADRLRSLTSARHALGELVVQQPSLHNSCHLAEHQAGELVLDDPGEAAGLLAKNAENVCSWGFGHGVLETFGKMNPSRQQWANTIKTCQELLGQETYALCADGLGHAAWDDAKTIPGAARRCEEIAEPAAVNACAGGVLMQRFRPAERRGAPSPTLPELKGFCDEQWPTSASPASLTGCAAGLGYVVAMGLVGDQVAAVVEGSTRTLGVQLDAARAAQPGLAAALAVCVSLQHTADDCVVTLIQHLPRHQLTDLSAMAELCAVMPPRWQTSCETLG